jgi:uncharacterized protein YndB with AHSA1/START domain
MSNKLTRTFELAVPLERAWQVFTDPKELNGWYAGGGMLKEFDARPGGRVVVGAEGMPDIVGEVREAVQPNRVVFTEGPGILPAETEITVTLEEAGTGTRVRITQAGFGDGEDWAGMLESYGNGWDEGIYDLQLYVLRGVTGNRFFTWQSSFGLAVRDTPAGAEVIKVWPETFGEQVDIRAGDLVLKVGNASIFGERDLSLLSREHPPGTKLEMTYVQGSQIRTREGTLTAMF